MQQESGHTKTKVIGGYILLLLLSILSTILIYKQITKLIVNEAISSDSSRKLYMIGNTISSLYEAETLSNAFVQTGSQHSFRKYIEIMDETKTNIDSLRKWTTRHEQQLRLDSISNLLEEKILNIQDLMYVKKSLVPEEFYNKAIAHIESGRDTLQEEINIVKRYVTTIDSSYVISDKKKRRGLFSRPQPDSILKVSTVHHIIVDTIDNSLQNTDTVVNILRSTWEDIQKQTQTINQQINRKEYALIRQSTIITDQLKRILNEYEKEEIYHAYQKQQGREKVITTMIHIFAWVAIIAFLLVVFFTFFILRDLSRSQRYRRELENANLFADQLLKSREKMIQTVTHDIKSPLSSVMGYIELLNNTAINERQHYFLKNMQGSARHILRLVSNLLDLSKLENNKMPLEKVVFNASQLFQEITDTFMPLAAAKQLELKSKFGKDLNSDFKGDALRIRQIITNILSNAIKYTSQGSVNFTAHISTDDKQVILKIQDTGSGMTPEEQKMIFQEFTRLKTHSGIEGTGLGLTITLKLIDLLGGEIRLQSEPGKGSCFTIILPLEKVTSSTVPLAEPPAQVPETISSDKPLNILLVDDDPLQLEMTANLLNASGIRTTTTTQPAEVITHLAAAPYDLLFSDIQMPGITGFELVKQIRQSTLPCASTLPIVALSADSDKPEADYLQTGFTAYLNKPFTSSQLLKLVYQLTGQAQTTPAKEGSSMQLPDTEGYTLKNIALFADNDPDTLNQILKSFVTTTEEHIVRLKAYLQARQWEAISQLAHKMLPMFRQLETGNLVIILEKLEHADPRKLPETEWEKRIKALLEGTEKLMENIKKQSD